MKFIVFIFFIFSTMLVWAGDLLAVENKMRAAFIYKFTSYIEWPSLTDRFNIAVIEDKEVYDLLMASTRGKSINASPIEIVLLSWEDLNKLPIKPSVLVFPKGSDRKIEQALDQLKKTPCLTVTYGEKLGTVGAMINFFSEDDHLRFEINKKALDEQQLKISAQLLRLGKIISESDGKR